MPSESSLPLILIADDNTDDLFFLRRRLDRIGVKNPVVTFSDGDRLSSFLRAMNVQRSREESLRVGVLFLDLELPNNAAFETLKWIQADNGMRQLHVVVLAEGDMGPRIRRAMELGVMHFIGKRPTVDAVAKAVRVALPPG